MLKIENLRAEVAGKEILQGLSLAVNAGEIHAKWAFSSPCDQ